MVENFSKFQRKERSLSLQIKMSTSQSIVDGNLETQLPVMCQWIIFELKKIIVQTVSTFQISNVIQTYPNFERGIRYINKNRLVNKIKKRVLHLENFSSLEPIFDYPVL